MGLNAVHYDLENWKGITVSKCALFTDYERADSEKPAMGLTTWKDAPSGKVLKHDIGI